MTNHLNSPQKRRYDNISLQSLFYKTFNFLKIQFLVLFCLISPYFRSTTTIPYNKKMQKPLYLLRFKALPFFPIKTDNPLILYMFIYLTELKINFPVPLFFSFLNNHLIKKGAAEPLSYFIVKTTFHMTILSIFNYLFLLIDKNIIKY